MAWTCLRSATAARSAVKVEAHQNLLAVDYEQRAVEAGQFCQCRSLARKHRLVLSDSSHPGLELCIEWHHCMRAAALACLDQDVNSVVAVDVEEV